MMRLWKILNADLTSCRVGERWIIGEWMPKIQGKIRPGDNGYHLCRDEDLINWLGPRIFPAEARGRIVKCNYEVVAAEARLTGPALAAWNDKSARLFACDCAERALPYLTDDVRSICAETISVARRYANGTATNSDLAAAEAVARAVARDTAGTAAAATAWAAASDAARNAAWDAAWAAAMTAVRAMARDKARAAVMEVARDPAKDAAWAAERKWQIERLMALVMEGQ